MADRFKVTTYDLIKAKKYLKKADPVLAKIIEKHPDLKPRYWMRELPKLDAFGTLLFQVIGQQLSVFSTRAILNRLTDLFGGRMPTPKELLTVSPAKLHKVGLSKRKVDTFRLIAENFENGNLNQKSLEKMSDDEITEKLTAIKGIGPWTAHGFLLIGLDRPDVIMTGDLALRKIVKKIYGLHKLPSEDRFSEISDKWKPFRTLATSYLFSEAYSGSNR